MNVVEVKDIDGTYGMYNANGDCVGSVCTDTGKAIIGRAFYSKDRTCQNDVIDTPEQLFKCSECGCEMWVSTERWDRDDVWDDPNLFVDDEESYPNYCPNCGAFIIGERPE